MMSDAIYEGVKANESLDPKADYLDLLNKRLEPWSKIIKTPTGAFIEQKYRVVNVETTGPLNWNEAYDINQEGTHTTGRRGELDKFIETGLMPFATQVNEGLSESPAVVFGYLKSGDALPDSETFRRNYGDIFAPDSMGYVVVVGAEITKTPDYELAGAEARVKVKVTPEMTKAIVVGNEAAERMVVDQLKCKGITLPVVRMSKSETAL